ncbi:hypothetical protein [Microvirga lenta]|uniref:hypothetical protein n=1 Tax=Microvirga lenta TaxID=2881337 RepID=UPI001CFFA305|nr:hypothetical protein [Microvirga lenta]MCB5176012.1 hypothetical protein [Microvirga lenta]
MTHYSSPTVQHFDGEYVTATLLNRAYNLRKEAEGCVSEAEARRFLDQAQELETASSLLELCQVKIADAYQIIGSLSDAAGLFDDPGVVRAMNYMADTLETMDEEYRFEIIKPTLRIRANDWFRHKWYRLRRGLGHRYDWERELESEADDETGALGKQL